jgi:hypothetical protein
VRLVLIAALLAAVGCGSDPAAGVASTDVLTGYLRFAGGATLPADQPVKVTVYRGDRRVASQTVRDTDPFRFRLARGSYDLRARAGATRCERRIAVHARRVQADLPCTGGTFGA